MSMHRVDGASFFGRNKLKRWHIDGYHYRLDGPAWYRPKQDTPMAGWCYDVDELKDWAERHSVDIDDLSDGEALMLITELTTRYI